MFQTIKKKKTDKIIIDLRKNSGGNSEVLNPCFIPDVEVEQSLKGWMEGNDEVLMYALKH